MQKRNVCSHNMLQNLHGTQGTEGDAGGRIIFLQRPIRNFVVTPLKSYSIQYVQNEVSLLACCSIVVPWKHNSYPISSEIKKMSQDYSNIPSTSYLQFIISFHEAQKVVATEIIHLHLVKQSSQATISYQQYSIGCKFFLRDASSWSLTILLVAHSRNRQSHDPRQITQQFKISVSAMLLVLISLILVINISNIDHVDNIGPNLE